MMLTKLYVKFIEVAKNDILKNEATGIHLVNVRGELNQPSKVMVRNNSITEIHHGYAIHLENSSVALEHNELRKNSSHGLMISGHNS